MTPLDTRTALERLCAFESVSHLSNLDLIHWVQAYLRGFGIESVLTHDDARRKANLHAMIGPADRPGLVLAGHTDVVPVDGQSWSGPPFKVRERDGKLYGRGTADMKGFIACVLSMVPEFLAAELAQPIHLALTYDEEVGCFGIPRLLDEMLQRVTKPFGCIVGEPTGMQIVTGQKGKSVYTARVRGRASHSALTHQGANAVEAAAEAVAHLKAMMRRHRDSGPFNAAYDPPHTTIHTGILRGGTALNIVPDDAYFEFEFRCIPEDDPERLLAEIRAHCEQHIAPELQRVAPDAGFTFEAGGVFHPLNTSDDAAVTKLARRLLGANDTHAISFATEAGHLAREGIPTIVCGPGWIEQAHKADEFVATEQLDRCKRFLGAIARALSAPSASSA